MKSFKSILSVAFILLSTSIYAQELMTTTGMQSLQSAEAKQTIDLIKRVNDSWQSRHKAECRGFWDNAAYFTGNQAVFEMTGEKRYLDYALRFANYNHWCGATERDKSKWEYKTYGEGMRHVLFADWQICFQIYIDLYKLEHRAERLTRALEVMNYQASMLESDFWWWSDALYMGMPIFSKLYTVTGNEKLLDKQYACFKWTDSLLFDKDAQLYYRDGKYVYPKVKTSCSDGKSFWARGDGWVLAGLAKVLQDLPKNHKYRSFYEDRFKQLSAGVARCQQSGGYWSRSMLCEGDAPGYETSGTAFFTYGLLWGLNNGYLNKSDYEPVVKKAWKYLSEVAVQPDYAIGYCQPIGEKPDPTRTVDEKSEHPFGTGAWLLAACEYARYCK
jgi:rhamnogalacturonyl hydrolase YesR